MLTFTFRSIALLLLLLLPAASVPLTRQLAQAQTPAGTDQQQPSDDEAGSIGFTAASVHWQRNSPVQLVGVQHVEADVRYAILLNAGSATIRSVRLGCYFEARVKGEQNATRILYMHTRDIPVNLAPGRFARARLRWVVDRHERYNLDVTQKNEIEAVLGVVNVRFAGRQAPFNYSLVRNGTFREVESRSIDAIYGRAAKRSRVDSYFGPPPKGGGSGVIGQRRVYACQFAGKAYNCRNTSDNCEDRTCQPGEHCDMKSCEWIDQNRPRKPGDGGNNWCPIPGYPTMCYGYSM
jgi:hypothetical protein